ncbi:MAG: hypothetical protein Q7S65_01500 [Nanoarchaeota archaeon]|nr:hypothetical protein [Nanoarchaeota archaeon]
MVTKQGTFRPFEVPDEREITHTDALRFPWREDKAGYFLVKIEGKEIQCGFLANNKMIFELRGTDPINMIKEIAKRNLINLEHMGYISAELMIAKQCVDSGKPYVQR